MPTSAIIYHLRFEVEGYTCNKVNDSSYADVRLIKMLILNAPYAKLKSNVMFRKMFLYLKDH